MHTKYLATVNKEERLYTGSLVQVTRQMENDLRPVLDRKPGRTWEWERDEDGMHHLIVRVGKNGKKLAEATVIPVTLIPESEMKKFHDKWWGKPSIDLRSPKQQELAAAAVARWEQFVKSGFKSSDKKPVRKVVKSTEPKVKRVETKKPVTTKKSTSKKVVVKKGKKTAAA